MAYHRSSGQLQTVLSYEYSTGNLIGHGAFALVFKGKRKQTLETVAIKQISLKSVPTHLSSIRQKEIAILKEVRHRNVVQLYDYHEERSHIYLVMEYCNGGDLGDYLQAKQTLSEHSIRHLTIHIANALSAIHRLHIIHRDIKPQNLLLSYPSPSPSGNGAGGKRDRTITDATIKLADFGFARYLTGTDMAATLCGSPLYMAPEILLGERYDSKADLWSVGTILYQCLSGSAPFLASNPHALRKRYVREKLVAKIPEGTSRYLASLLTKLLKKNRKERLSHEELCAHPFLGDPSIQTSGYLVMDPQPPRAKSSPVPIRRHTPSPSPSPYTTSRHSGSQCQSPYETFLSPSSGPPSIHPVGSASSLARQQSPHSDITDHGFILVASPHQSSSPLSSTTSSPRSGSYSSCRSHTPSSSFGSSKLNSLTTPFYQAPPTSRSSNGSTPSIKGSDVIANSSPTHGEQYHRPRSRSNSSKRRSSDPFAGGTPLSHTPPFGKLMQLATTPTTVPSPYSSPYGTLSRQTSLSPSPTSVTDSPSSKPLSHIATATGASNAATSGRLSSRGSFRYSLSAHGSGSKLSSLVEQAELDTQKQRSIERNKKSEKIAANKGESSQHTKSGVCLDNLITTSQVLGSDEDEEEVDFPLSLSLHSSQSSNKTDEQEMVEVREGREEGGSDGGGGKGWGGLDVATPTCKAKQSQGGSGGSYRRCKSAGHGGVAQQTSFSRQFSDQLTENFHQINSRAANLSAHQSLLESDSSMTPTTLKDYDFQVSPAAKIKPMAPTFHLPSPTSSSSPAPLSRPLSASSPANSRGLNDKRSGSFTTAGGIEISDTEVDLSQHKGSGDGKGEGEEVTTCLAPLRQSMALVRELVGMAKARQGPIMLLSTDLSSSGGASRSQRHSEQLVLYAKALSVLDSGLRRFQIEMATSSMELDQTLRTVEMEAGEMQESCLEKARHVREEIEKVRGGGPHHHHPSHYHPSPVSAERLLLIEALDMCKHAVLNEQTGDNKECIKRYRIAKLIFSQLLCDAKTARDKSVLSNYIHSVTRRIHKLTSNPT